MPTYEYVCTKCHYAFEEFQSMHDEPIKICPQCHGDVRKKISGGAALVFKGSGFYETDYKKKTPSPKPEKTTKKAS